MKPNDTDKKVMPEPSNLGAALSLMSSDQGWGGQRRENNVHPTKEERDQWRERLSSPYTCFDAAHADFTIRLLDALEAAERKAYLLEQSNLWIAAVAFNETASDYGSMYGLVEASRKAVEEGR